MWLFFYFSLLRGDVIEELVSLIITEPSKELPEKEQYKHASIACELLTCDLPALNERLASNHALLDRLYSFLDTESALNPLLASYFSRTLTILISRRSEQVKLIISSDLYKIYRKLFFFLTIMR